MAQTTTDMTETTTGTSGWVGWIFFASMMMLIIGSLQIIAGLVAIFQRAFYVVGPEGLVVWNYATWGWVHIILGTLLFITAISVMSGKTWARILASILVALNAISNLVFLPAYPIWSIIALVIDGFVLYALTVHGGELRAPRDQVV